MKAFTILSLATVASANDNGLALTPPQGWRSWNLFGNNVNQQLIMSIMKGMTDRSNMVDGKPTSLCDLGYCDVGLDDNWQDCGSKDAAFGMHYHDKEGNPLVNYKRFPDFKNMTDYAHTLGLTSGWYGNNCDCSDHCITKAECDMQIKQDVAAHHKYGFDSWKLDGCGGETDLVAFNKYTLGTFYCYFYFYFFCQINRSLKLSIAAGWQSYPYLRLLLDSNPHYSCLVILQNSLTNLSSSSSHIAITYTLQS
mgnify:CR=1 FL=1|tara:strand:- start:403 stop:1158 length:756 start_codon:yes stop_codon:yes gene_type:complete